MLKNMLIPIKSYSNINKIIIIINSMNAMNATTVQKSIMNTIIVLVSWYNSSLKLVFE